jgi:lipoate-protein ligase A
MYELTQNDNLAVTTLADEKFRTWKWNFGYSPAYDFINVSYVEGLDLNINLHVEKGLIIRSELKGDFFSGRELAYLNNKLKGQRHHFEDVRAVLQTTRDEVTEDLVFSFF